MLKGIPGGGCSGWGEGMGAAWRCCPGVGAVQWVGAVQGVGAVRGWVLSRGCVLSITGSNIITLPPPCEQHD